MLRLPIEPTVAFFRISRSISSVLTRLRSCASSSRSAVVNAPDGPPPESISAWLIQRRTAVSERPRSLATVPMPLPLLRMSATTSALYSFENDRRFLFPMRHSYRTFVRSVVSTKPGQAQGEGQVRERVGRGPWPISSARDVTQA